MDVKRKRVVCVCNSPSANTGFLRMRGGVSGCKGKGKVSSTQRARRLQLKWAWEKVERCDCSVIGWFKFKYLNLARGISKFDGQF